MITDVPLCRCVIIVFPRVPEAELEEEFVRVSWVELRERVRWEISNPNLLRGIVWVRGEPPCRCMIGGGGIQISLASRKGDDCELIHNHRP